MVEPHVVTLRATRAGDLDELFHIRLDPESEHSAPLAAAPPDRAAFDAEWARLAARGGSDARTVRSDGRIVGEVASWVDADTGMPEIAYWIDREHRGRGIATRAVRLLLDTLPRPVRARIAADDTASAALLTRLGFVEVGGDRTEEIGFVLR